MYSTFLMFHPLLLCMLMCQPLIECTKNNDIDINDSGDNIIDTSSITSNVGSRLGKSFASSRGGRYLRAQDENGYVHDGYYDPRSDQNALLGVTMGGLGSVDYCGYAVSGLGDVNGDGVNDFIVGSFYADPELVADAGEAYVLFGGNHLPANLNLQQLDGTNGFTIQGVSPFDNTAYSVSGSGVTQSRGSSSSSSGSDSGSTADINGDGLADIILGAPQANDGAGCTYVLFGRHIFPAKVPLALLLPTTTYTDTSTNSRDDFYVMDSFTNNSTFASSNSSSDAAEKEWGFVVYGNKSNDHSGWSVAGGFDFNDDGYGDVLVGTSMDSESNAVGESYVIFGRPFFNQTNPIYVHSLGPPPTIKTTDESKEHTEEVVKVTETLTRTLLPPVSEQQESLLVAPVAALGFVIYGTQAGDQCGAAVAAAYDVNGDSIHDIVIGCPSASTDTSKTKNGAAFVVYGAVASDHSTLGSPLYLSDIYSSVAIISSSSSATGTWAASRGFAMLGENTGDAFGYSVSAAPNLNGDNWADLIIGAPYATPPPPVTVDERGFIPDDRRSSGRSYVVFGFASSSSSTSGGVMAGADDIADSGVLVDITALHDNNSGFVINGVIAYDFSGAAVAHAGDMNSDGYSDLAIGAPYQTTDGGKKESSGVVYVVYGKPSTGTSSTSSTSSSDKYPSTGFELAELYFNGRKSKKWGFAIEGVNSEDYAGFSVSGALDINNDGRSDLLMGAPDLGGNRAGYPGSSYILFGTKPNTWLYNMELSSLTTVSESRSCGSVATESCVFDSIANGGQYAACNDMCACDDLCGAGGTANEILYSCSYAFAAHSCNVQMKTGWYISFILLSFCAVVACCVHRHRTEQKKRRKRNNNNNNAMNNDDGQEKTGLCIVVLLLLCGCCCGDEEEEEEGEEGEDEQVTAAATRSSVVGGAAGCSMPTTRGQRFEGHLHHSLRTNNHHQQQEQQQRQQQQQRRRAQHTRNRNSRNGSAEIDSDEYENENDDSDRSSSSSSDSEEEEEEVEVQVIVRPPPTVTAVAMLDIDACNVHTTFAVTRQEAVNEGEEDNDEAAAAAAQIFLQFDCDAQGTIALPPVRTTAGRAPVHGTTAPSTTGTTCPHPIATSVAVQALSVSLVESVPLTSSSSASASGTRGTRYNSNNAPTTAVEIL